MNLQQFKQKLRDLKTNQIRIANDLGITDQQVSNWNKANKYPAYVDIYFENIDNKEELKSLKLKINSLLND